MSIQEVIGGDELLGRELQIYGARIRFQRGYDIVIHSRILTGRESFGWIN